MNAQSHNEHLRLKFIYSEKATKFCEMEISQNFVAFSEYMNFSKNIWIGNRYIHTCYICIFLGFFTRMCTLGTRKTTERLMGHSHCYEWLLDHDFLTKLSSFFTPYNRKDRKRKFCSQPRRYMYILSFFSSSFFEITFRWSNWGLLSWVPICFENYWSRE